MEGQRKRAEPDSGLHLDREESPAWPEDLQAVSWAAVPCWFPRLTRSTWNTQELLEKIVQFHPPHGTSCLLFYLRMVIGNLS